MAKEKNVTVQLGDYLADQPGVALKDQLSAPIAYRLERLIRVTKSVRVLGDVSPNELIAALLHSTRPDARTLKRIVERYRDDRVWHTRESLGEPTATEGEWRIRLRGPGERWG